MLDNHDREKFAAIYRLLADVLEHEARVDRSDDAVSYRLGDLAARVFIGAPAEPPDEVLESARPRVAQRRLGGPSTTGGPAPRSRRAVGTWASGGQSVGCTPQSLGSGATGPPVSDLRDDG